MEGRLLTFLVLNLTRLVLCSIDRCNNTLRASSSEQWEIIMHIYTMANVCLSRFSSSSSPMTSRGAPGHLILGFITAGYLADPSFPAQSKSITLISSSCPSVPRHMILFGRKSPWTTLFSFIILSNLVSAECSVLIFVSRCVLI